jgi:hypothetical protein
LEAIEQDAREKMAAEIAAMQLEAEVAAEEKITLEVSHPSARFVYVVPVSYQ